MKVLIKRSSQECAFLISGVSKDMVQFLERQYYKSHLPSTLLLCGTLKVHSLSQGQNYLLTNLKKSFNIRFCKLFQIIPY